MSQVRALGDFAHLYNWDVVFLGSPKGVDLQHEGLNIRATSTTLPKKTTAPIDIQIRNHHIQRPGITDSDHTLTLSFVETEDMYLLEKFTQWQKLSQESDTGNQEKYEDIAVDMRIRRLNKKGEPTREYLIKGAWVTEFDNGGDLGSESEIARPTLTLAYDDFNEGAPGSLT